MTKQTKEWKIKTVKFKSLGEMSAYLAKRDQYFLDKLKALDVKTNNPSQ